MKIIRDSDEQRIDSCVATIGAFDGVHLGHQAVIHEVKRRATARGVASAVVTFDVHPALVVRPESAPLLLSTLDAKLELIEELGVDVVYVIEFDEVRATTTAEEFLQKVFVERLRVVEIVVGSDFHFGKGREGTVDFLRERGEQFGFVVDGLELIRHADDATEHVSSTAIRRALTGGDVEGANAMLGRAFEIRGTVLRGDQRGKSIGFPTANVALLEGMARPANGVYACTYRHPDGSEYSAAANVGVRPTFYENAEGAVLEAHLLDFEGDLYETEARVSFRHFLRSERRFNGIDELRAQLDSDVEVVRTLLTG